MVKINCCGIRETKQFGPCCDLKKIVHINLHYTTLLVHHVLVLTYEQGLRIL